MGEQLDAFLEGVAPRLVPSARMAIVSTRRIEAAMVKSFMRRHEDTHPLFLDTPACRLHELHPLLRTDGKFAVRQACDPLWPSSDDSGRRARTLATHVLERTVRRSQPLSVNEYKAEFVRADSELYVQPALLPF